MGKTSETVLEIDLTALAHNYKFITSQLSPNTKVMGVVKAFGYGSDAIAVAKELVSLGVDYFAVAYVKEGVALRAAGIETPILVLHPQPNNFNTLIERCLEPAIYSKRILDLFITTSETLQQQNYPVHIKFNTGLNRLGFTKDEVPHIVEKLSTTNSVHVRSLFSHLAASEDLEEIEYTQKQIAMFSEISEEMIEHLGYKPLLHQTNTSGIFNFPEAHFSMVRTGIGLYGYGNTTEMDQQLRPVATLKSVISQIHDIAPGETVGYNRAHKASTTQKSATIPIGHADGISRQLGNAKGAVLVNGKKAPIIGNVCMDMLMVDVSHINCEEGDEVIIIGASQDAVAMAKGMNSISYELLTAISQRVKRVLCRNALSTN